MVDGTGSREPHSGSSTLIVSACLLGVRCTDQGGHNRNEAVIALAADHRLIPVCPETAGGLPTPRPRAERRGGVVVTADGGDRTDAFRRGAEHAVALASAAGATRAVLKARSPSCGCHEVYDGTFTRTKVQGMGVTAEALVAAGVEVISEDDLAPS